MVTDRFCPNCKRQRLKIELKMLPNKVLACEKCQAVFRIAGNMLTGTGV